MSKVKISFVGDIMCEKPMLKASKKDSNTYDFTGVFDSTREIFSRSDYVVANLETPFAGAEAGYTSHIYSFNTPDSFLSEVEKSGIGLVTGANNHCLDRGTEGLKRTIEKLKESRLDFVGIGDSDKISERVFIKDFDGFKVAFLSYTYGTNTSRSKTVLDGSEAVKVNLLKSQTAKLYATAKKSGLKRKFSNGLKLCLGDENMIKLKKRLHKPYNNVRPDDVIDEKAMKTYLDEIKGELEYARENSDFVVMCPHMGGQFNTKPGKYSRYMMKFFSQNGADVVVANHPHVVEPIERDEEYGTVCAYSLGNFSISPNSVYVLHEDLPEYSICFHLYFQNKKIDKMTFSVIKITEESGKLMNISPVWDLLHKQGISSSEAEKLKKDTAFIYRIFTGVDMGNDVMEEFELSI